MLTTIDGLPSCWRSIRSRSSVSRIRERLRRAAVSVLASARQVAMLPRSNRYCCDAGSAASSTDVGVFDDAMVRNSLL